MQFEMEKAKYTLTALWRKYELMLIWLSIWFCSIFLNLLFPKGVTL